MTFTENNLQAVPASAVAKLFEPFRYGPLELSSRIVMAPMARGFSPNGVPGPDVADYYRRRAEQQVGLVITENISIPHPSANQDPTIYPDFNSEEARAGWKHVVDEVHRVGGKIIPQLMHTGIARAAVPQPDGAEPSISPSGLDVNGERQGEPMTVEEIREVIAAYAEAAAEAQRLGFDGIELHGAHGYLIDQFLWEGTNRRTDEYGGSIAKRTRFAAEVIAACRQAVGPDFPIIFRFSQWKFPVYTARLAQNPEELAEVLKPLAAAGVDIFHASTRRFWEPEFEGSSLSLAGWAKQITGQPTISVGSVGLQQDFAGFMAGEGSEPSSLNDLTERMATSEFDLVAVGRALLADPAWAVKIRDGREDELKPFHSDAIGTLY
ncbi:NADH:flavin oxidoreductase [Paenibacillus bovis]|uniref:12-oxophytodienoate reductase n=1 Tax=Paenibacillus bovis TaxID=1616788 RepID=A0A172ZCG8_9BACL|nr:NADH:flavin oxidoreductase [Paenibacillus bovis]ANF95345.1 12-oxophytodienoate reductase [Paenibacillus bovis]